jgi:hypothetical protein
MSDDGERNWWINTPTGVEGPFTREEILEAGRSGRLKGETLICQGQAGQWLAASITVPEAFTESPTNVDAQIWASSSNAAPARADLARQESVGLSVFLTFITLGIWFVVWLYPRLTWYAQQSGRPMGNRVTYYWLLIGFTVGSFVLGLVTLLLWFPLFIGAIVFGSLLTYDLVKDQQIIVSTRGAGAGLAATPTTLVVLYAVGNGIGITLVLLPATLVLLIIFYWLFFKNHNAAVASVTQ